MSGYSDRDYLDGFVYIDPGTADPETDIPGLTWYWGYDSSAQYTGESVRFHGAPQSDYRIFGLPMESWQGSENMDMPGLDISGGRRLWHRGPVSLGISGGVNWSQEKTVQFAAQGVVARETYREWRQVDVYDAPYLPFPDAPYAGTYEGPGYLINNIPDSREIEQVSRFSRDWVARSTVDVEVGMLDVRIGPSLWLDLHQRLALRVTPQVRVAHVETKARSWTEISPTSRGPLTFEENHNRRDWIFGGGIEAEARVYLHKGWHLGFAVASDWWEDTVDVAVNPFDLHIELGQWSFVASLGVEF